MFYGIEQAYANAMIQALLASRQALFDTRVQDAIKSSHVPHKGDTRGLDQRPENAITATLQQFDPNCIIITEERGMANPFIGDELVGPQGSRTFFGCDPFDRSNQACEFLSKHGKPDEKVVDVLRREESSKIWISEYGGPLSISSSTSAICCIRRGLPIAAAILNHFADELTMACAAGIYHITLPKDLSIPVDLEYVQNGKRITFPQPPSAKGAAQKIVTFMGKPERGYPANFENCRLISDKHWDDHLHYRLPGGPSRVLYLSSLQPSDSPIGVVVANGEKIGEWIHWLAFVRFAHREDDHSAQALRLFEVTQDQSFMIDECLMMPPRDYSVFVNPDDRQRRVIISSEKLQKLRNPSKYRSTLILIPANNRWALDQVEQYGYREIVFK